MITLSLSRLLSFSILFSPLVLLGEGGSGGGRMAGRVERAARWGSGSQMRSTHHRDTYYCLPLNKQDIQLDFFKVTNKSGQIKVEPKLLQDLIASKTVV